MPRAPLTLLLAVFLLLAGAPPPARAQAPASPGPAAVDHTKDMTRFAIDYTQTVAVGIVGGGSLLHLLVGGPAATLVGALAGSTLASWLFINHEARHYVIERTGSGSSRPSR